MSAPSGHVADPPLTGHLPRRMEQRRGVDHLTAGPATYGDSDGTRRALSGSGRRALRTLGERPLVVQDGRSRYHNQLRLGSRGGFARHTHGFHGSEHLARMGSRYDYAGVVDFTRPGPVIGRGSGIFLHAFGDVTTGGCVSVERSHMRAILRWLDPAAHPRIVIGEDDRLATPT